MDGNLHIRVLDPDDGLVDERKVHNVFTDIGKTWLRDLCYWSVISNPDISVEEVRPRWMMVGTGYQLGVQSVTGLVTPETFNGTDYLKVLQNPTFSPITTVRYTVDYGGTELAGLNLTEFGLIVDNGSLSVTSPSQEVVAYRSFLAPVTKSAGQTLTLDWELRF